MIMKDPTSIDIIGVFDSTIMKRYVNEYRGNEIVIYTLITRIQDPLRKTEYRNVSTDYIEGNKRLASSLVISNGNELGLAGTNYSQLDSKKYPLTQLVEFHLEQVRKERERLNTKVN